MDLQSESEVLAEELEMKIPVALPVEKDLFLLEIMADINILFLMTFCFW